MFSIDHIGVAVKSLAAAKAIYEKLGLRVSPEELVEAEQVRVVMVPVGESRLELLEPTSENSVIAKFIAKRGEGLHHICFRVSDIDAVMATMVAAGVRFIDAQPRQGAHGSRIAFIHPSSAGGLLIELKQAAH